MFPSERYDVTPVHGDQRGSGHFDQVYEVHDRVANETRIVLVEAKSPSGELGTRKGLDGVDYQQGHPEYVVSVVDEMRTRGEDDLADKIESALVDEQLDYYLVRARIKSQDGNNAYDGFSVDQFRMDQD